MSNKTPFYDYNIREDERVEITADNEVIGLIAEEETENFLHIVDFFYDTLVDNPAEKDSKEWIADPNMQELIEHYIKNPDKFEEIK